MIEQHLASITLSGHRPRTVRSRGIVLRTFAGTLPHGDLFQAERHHVEAFLARPLAAQSRSTYLGHLRAFYRWAVDMEHTDTDPTAKLRRPRIPAGVPRPIEAADLALALDQADPRMRAWLLLMSLAGLRCLEVAALRPSDLREMDGFTVLFLRETKGGGTATVPAHPAIVEALAALPVENGKWWQAASNHVSTLVSRHLRALGIEATAHQLRHAAGTAWYVASGHDLLTTARLLRHVNVATTMVYARLDPTRPAEVVNLVPLPSAS